MKPHAPCSIVPDRDAGQRGLAGTDHVPARGDKVDPVTQGRQLDRPVRVVGHDRASARRYAPARSPSCCSPALPHPAIGFPRLRCILAHPAMIGGLRSLLRYSGATSSGKKRTGARDAGYGPSEFWSMIPRSRVPSGSRRGRPGCRFSSSLRPLCSQQMHDAGVLYLLGHVPEQAVMAGDDDFGRPPARPDSQCTKLNGQPPGSRSVSPM